MKIQYFSFSSRPEKGITDTHKNPFQKKAFKRDSLGCHRVDHANLLSIKDSTTSMWYQSVPVSPRAKDHFHCCCIMTIKLSHITPTVYCAGVASQTSDDHVLYHCPTIGPHYP